MKSDLFKAIDTAREELVSIIHKVAPVMEAAKAVGIERTDEPLEDFLRLVEKDPQAARRYFNALQIIHETAFEFVYLQSELGGSAENN